MTDRELLELASQAREHAYAPYSHFRVGAALLCKDGTVYQGCNIENASFGATNCAERTAFFRAVYDGQSDPEWEALTRAAHFSARSYGELRETGCFGIGKLL